MKIRTRTQQHALYMQRFIALTMFFIMIGMFIAGHSSIAADKQTTPKIGAVTR